MDLSPLRLLVLQRLDALSKAMDGYERAKTFGGGARRRPWEIVAEAKDDIAKLFDDAQKEKP